MCEFMKAFNEWGKDFPHLFENYKKGKVYSYDNLGFTRELTEKQKETIKKLEKDYEKYGIKIICVLEADYQFEDGDVAHMTSYVTLDDHAPFQHLEKGIYSVLAYVDNESWDIQEYGMIGIQEKVGLLQRIY